MERLQANPEYAVGMIAMQAAVGLCGAVRTERVLEGAAALDKEDHSPVTVADFGAQALVCRIVSAAFPDDPIVAEERSAALQEPENAPTLAAVTRYVQRWINGATPARVCDWIDLGGGEPTGRFWTLDPIDGTKGFLRGDQYAVALALIEAGMVQWGFLACPALPHEGGHGVLFVARRGAGAWRFALDSTLLGPCRVSGTRDPAAALLVESMESGHTNRSRSARLKERLGVRADSRRLDSQAKYGVVAAGEAELYLRAPNPRTPDYREAIWDHAAGCLVVQEAGGTVTDIAGYPLDWTQGRRLEVNRGVVATNGWLHGAVVEALEA